jgi:choice-of-anchor C domain-containing protein
MNTPLKITQAIYSLVAIVAGSELCSAQIVSNGSFETGAPPPLGGTFVPAPNSTAIPGWTVQSGSVDYIGSDTWQAENGVRSLDMNGHEAGSILQNVSGFTAGLQYRLSFYMAANDGSPAIKHLEAHIDSVTQTFTFDGSGTTYANMGWSFRSMDFTANNATMALTFSSLDAGPAGAALDNVSISLVPEPSTASFFGAAAVLALLRRNSVKRPRWFRSNRR